MSNSVISIIAPLIYVIVICWCLYKNIYTEPVAACQTKLPLERGRKAVVNWNVEEESTAEHYFNLPENTDWSAVEVECKQKSLSVERKRLDDVSLVINQK